MADLNTPTGEQNPAPASTPSDDKSGTSSGLADAVFDDGVESDLNDEETPTPAKEGDPKPADEKPADEKPANEKPVGDDKDKPEVNQEAVNKKINTLTFQKHEEQRKREAAEKRAQELETKLAELNKQDSDIVIPPMPDTFDPEYDKKMVEREAAIKKQAQVDYEKQVIEKQKKDAQDAEIKRQQEAIQASVDKMYTGAKTLGFKEDEFQKADLRVSQFVRNPLLAQHLLNHEEGPSIVMYLSSSAEQLEKIAAMDPINAAVYIATEIVPKAQGLKPKPSDAPAPLDVEAGRAPKPDGSPYMVGVTLE